MTALVPNADAQDPVRPQFRSGVTITRLEVTVLDKSTRTPVTGLTAGDFVIKVNGERQPVVSAAEIVVPAAEPDTAPVLAEAADDVATNALRPSRLFVLILNDSGGGRAPFYGMTGRAIAHQFIDRLGPDDLAAVTFVRDNSPAQDFTRDRTLLRRAIDRYNPGGGFPCALTVVRSTQEFLQSMPGYRRAIVFVSPVGIGSCPDRDWYLQDIGFSARFAHVPVYAFSAHGLEAPRPDDLRPGNVRANPFARYDGHVELMRTLAGLTEGRATVHTNAPADAVPAVFEELGSYYAVAYEHTYPLDGRLRRFEIDVTRPDAVVVSSRRLLETPESSENAAEARTPGAGRAFGLMDALEAPLASGDLPLRLSSLPLAVPGVREQAVALTLNLPPSTTAEDFRVQLLVFDGEGRRQLSSQTMDVAVPAGSGDRVDDGQEVALRLDLRPGRYNLRLVAERERDRLAGSVHATVVVPDFARESLSLSGVGISRSGGRPIAGFAELEALLPASPTAVRAFSPGDRVDVFLRVHESTRRAPQPVVLQTEVIDAIGSVVSSATRTLSPDEFDASAAAEHRFALPLAQLDAGVYLLRFVATTGGARARRDVKFEVQ